MKKRMKKLVLIVLSLFLAMGVFAGCGTSDGESADGEAVTYKMGISAYPAFYTWYICEAEGFFEANGIDVELVYFPVYSDSVQAFNTGQVDMLAVAMPDVVAPYINDIPFESVLVLDNSMGADGLVATSDITSLDQLAGKSIATEYGTIEHFFLLTALQTVGLTEDDIEFVNLSIADSAPAFLSGRVDAASLWEPSLSMALEKEGANLLISSAETPGLIPDVLIADGDMVENHKDDIEKVIHAYYDAMDFYVENEAQAIEDMAVRAEITNEDMEIAMSGSKLFTLEEGIATMDNVAQDYSYLPYTTEKIAEFLYEIGMIDSMPDDATKLVNSEYMKNVLEERGSSQVPATQE